MEVPVGAYSVRLAADVHVPEMWSLWRAVRFARWQETRNGDGLSAWLCFMGAAMPAGYGDRSVVTLLQVRNRSSILVSELAVRRDQEGQGVDLFQDETGSRSEHQAEQRERFGEQGDLADEIIVTRLPQDKFRVGCPQLPVEDAEARPELLFYECPFEDATTRSSCSPTPVSLPSATRKLQALRGTRRQWRRLRRVVRRACSTGLCRIATFV
jgi:hypothetical protein